jgi:lysozyme
VGRFSGSEIEEIGKEGFAAMTILEQLKRDEGLQLTPYKDSVGKLTIGYGRNLDDVGISTEEASSLLLNDIERTTNDLSKHLPWIAGMDQARAGVLLNMAFNIGIYGLLGFKKFLALAEAMSYTDASEEMLNSKWAEQVGARAHRLSLQMRSGEWQ